MKSTIKNLFEKIHYLIFTCFMPLVCYSFAILLLRELKEAMESLTWHSHNFLHYSNTCLQAKIKKMFGY
jgi:hypothetical protein